MESVVRSSVVNTPAATAALAIGAAAGGIQYLTPSPGAELKDYHIIYDL